MKPYIASDDVCTSVSGAIGVFCGGLLAHILAQNEVDQHKLDREYLSNHRHWYTAANENQGCNTRGLYWVRL